MPESTVFIPVHLCVLVMGEPKIMWADSDFVLGSLKFGSLSHMT